jgi:hypothetical protein
MFYFIVALAIAGYLIYRGLQKIQRKSLVAFCPCVLALSTIIALVLFQSDHKVIALSVFLIGLYIFAIDLAAIRKLSVQKLSTSTGTFSQPQ